jgi:hypothetical protein
VKCRLYIVDHHSILASLQAAKAYSPPHEAYGQQGLYISAVTEDSIKASIDGMSSLMKSSEVI